MRRIKIWIIFLFAFVLVQVALSPDEWGNCYCVSNLDIFVACESRCGSEEDCKGVHKQGGARCIDTNCRVAYYSVQTMD